MKSKSPAFQFYPKQWMGDDKVIPMDWATRGIHHHLMCLSWEQDEPATLPNNSSFLLKILSNSGEKITKKRWENFVFPQLLTSWKVWDEDPTRLIQNGLRREYIKQKARSDKARKGADARWKKDANASTKHGHNDALLEDEVEVEVEIEVKASKKEKEPTQKKTRDHVEEFLIFAQKTHVTKRKSLVMIRQVVDRDKIKSVLDDGIPSKLLKVAWLLFLIDDGEYFRGSDAPPHNIAVFEGQLRAGKYLEKAAGRVRAAAKFRHKPKPALKPANHTDPELEKFWADCKENIKDQILPESYNTWFEPTYPRTLEDGLLTIAVPNQFYRKCFIENYRDLIETTVKRIRGSPLLVDFCIEADRPQPDTGEE